MEEFPDGGVEGRDEDAEAEGDGDIPASGGVGG